MGIRWNLDKLDLPLGLVKTAMKGLTIKMNKFLSVEQIM